MTLHTPFTPPAPPAPAPRRTGLLIGLLAAAGVLVLLVAGGTAWFLSRTGDDPVTGGSDLSALTDYRTTTPEQVKAVHQEGPITYPMTPPAGGPHNPHWQNCMGDVYPAPIPSERAVHSLEHGAVWITYDPARVGAASVATLAKKVTGREYVLMSPYPGQRARISVQAWGYQLGVESANDRRIEAFVVKYRITATLEPSAPCSGGLTTLTL